MQMILHKNVQSEILLGLQTGMSFRRVAELIGYSVEDIGKAMMEDPTFATQVRQAQAKPEHELLQRMHSSEQWQAWKFLLQSLYPTRYVSSRKKPGTLQPPKLESEQTRLARLNKAELAQLLPITEKMDGKRVDAPDSQQRRHQERAAGEGSS
jgi:hypothetical protein